MNPSSWHSVLGKDGLSRLAAEYRPRLLRFFESLGADSKTAEDLCQELFLKLLRTQASYDERGQMHAYLFRMANHLWIDHSRLRRPLLTAEPSEEGLERLRERDPDPSIACENEESRARLREAMASLSPPQRAAFEMGVIQGMRYRDIAAALGIPLGTVKTRIFAAAGKIRTLLSDQKEEEIKGSARRLP